MNPSVRFCTSAGWHRTFRIAGLGLLAALALATGRAEPPTREATPARAAQPHEGGERGAGLTEAARLRQLALTTRDEAQRAYCFDRALDIYASLGRVHEIIATADRYQESLQRILARVPGQVETRRRLRELELQLGECYLSLGHYDRAEAYLGRAAAELRGVAPLPPVKKLTALAGLARIAEKRGDRERAGRSWRRAEEFAQEQLNDPRADLTPSQRIECTWKLADSYRFRGDADRGVRVLQPLLVVHDQLGDQVGKRNTLRRLAQHHADGGKYREAEEDLRQALQLHADAIMQAELVTELAEVLARQGPDENRPRRDRAGRAQVILHSLAAQTAAPAVSPAGLLGLRVAALASLKLDVFTLRDRAEPGRLREQAVRDYRAVLESPAGGRPDAGRVITAFWGLQALYQKGSQYNLALQLADVQEKEWGDVLSGPKMKSTQGTLQAAQGRFPAAQKLLREAVAALEQQSPPNYVDLPRAWNNLAVAEQAAGELEKAEKLAEKCLQHYQKFGWPGDLVEVEALNVLGTCAAARGQYAQAIKHFRQAATLCARLGPTAELPRSRLLLNEALLHKSQGDLARALEVCQAAREAYQKFAATDPFGAAAFDAAEANLLAATGDLARAYQRTPNLLAFCAEHQITSGPLVVTAHHCQGLYHLALARRNFPAAEQARNNAEQAWNKLKSLQEAEKDSPLLARTLNYLGLTAEVRGDLKRAEEMYRAAQVRQQAGRQALPATHFITLWRLANLADRRGQLAEARRLLEEAVGVVEEARLQTYGAAQQRATFFAQFEPGFEQLVDWCVRDGDPEAAFRAVIRSRSRALLDYLQLAGADPRKSLQDEEGKELLKHEEKLRQQISGLRAQLQLVLTGAADPGDVQELRTRLNQAQHDYVKAWGEVLNASPLYRSLAVKDPSADVLKELRQRVLVPNTLLLAYHIGRDCSYLLLLGNGMAKPEVFRLTVSADVAKNLVDPPPRGVRPVALLRRGLELELVPEQFPKPVPLRPAVQVPPDASVPLTQDVARRLVEHYSRQLANPRSGRGFELQPLDSARSPRPKGPELLGDVLLPPAVRQRIRDAGPTRLVVIPDGPLHKLPLEAVVLRQEGGQPRYVLDEFPPLVYAPSAAVLTFLAARERPRPKTVRDLALLTVSNPAYPQVRPAAPLPAGDDELALLRALPLLEGTEKESRRIAGFFDRFPVVALGGARATEGMFRAALHDPPGAKPEGEEGKPVGRVVHLAAHGFAHEKFSNLFGGIALTPPRHGGVTAEDDGFLTLHELYTLALTDCELAVLSACVTNVGPQEPLEAGVTLASGFLTAGAHRVVATHWSVNDESAAFLMEAFFQELTTAARKGKPLDYALALQEARKAVRNHKVNNEAKWSAPLHWAPFVLIGPAG